MFFANPLLPRVRQSLSSFENVGAGLRITVSGQITATDACGDGTSARMSIDHWLALASYSAIHSPLLTLWANKPCSVSAFAAVARTKTQVINALLDAVTTCWRPLR